jgi:hypothetical protein
MIIFILCQFLDHLPFTERQMSLIYSCIFVDLQLLNIYTAFLKKIDLRNRQRAQSS